MTGHSQSDTLRRSPYRGTSTLVVLNRLTHDLNFLAFNRYVNSLLMGNNVLTQSRLATVDTLNVDSALLFT